MTSSAAPSSPNEAMSDDEECPYQMSLLVLCGFGWMADNMWLEAVAIILPRVQDHYAVSDGSIGWLSSSIFCGMMIGAIGWGTCSDLLGRTIAFNATLLLTGFFGVCASYFGTGIVSLCIALFFLGTAIGGSMPTDGTLFLENIPRRNRYLLTCLSVFFSFGAVLSAVVGLFVIPSSSCPAPPSPCDVETQNLGWKRLLYTLSGITIAMSLGRFILFRLYESPRFLVNTGRHEEAVHALQKITAFNGQPLKLNVKDVDDTYAPMTDPVVFDEGAGENQHLNPSSPLPYQDRPLDSPERFSSAPIVYSATGDDALPLEGDYSFHTPIEERACMKFPSPQTSPTIRLGSLDALSPRSRAVEIGSSRSPRSSMHVRRKSSMSVVSLPPVVEGFILDRITDPLRAWWEKVSTLLSDEWRRSTLLIWAMWSLMSLAYTMFNVFLPKLLEKRMGHAGGEGKEKALWEVVIFTLGGCPGALLGAWMIETPLGRRKSLAISTFVTAFFCVAFCEVSSQAAVTATTVAISLAATTMWAVLYGMTPEIFEPHVRGTACGTASALSRIGGMIAPLLGGQLLVVSTSLPMYVAAVILAVAGFCVLGLPAEGSPNEKDYSYYQLSH